MIITIYSTKLKVEKQKYQSTSISKIIVTPILVQFLSQNEGDNYFTYWGN